MIKETKPHYLYWAKFVSIANPNVDLEFLGTKIGITEDPFSRMTSLGGGTKVPMDVVAEKLYRFPSKKTTKLAEDLLHHMNESTKVVGEWFLDIDSHCFMPVVTMLQGIEVDPSEFGTRDETPVVGHQEFWDSFDPYIEKWGIPAPMPSHKTMSSVYCSTGITNVNYRYRANRGDRASIALTTDRHNQSKVRHLWTEPFLSRLKNTFHEEDITIKVPDSNASGYIEVMMQNERNGNNEALYDELADSMNRFQTIFHQNLTNRRKKC